MPKPQTITIEVRPRDLKLVMRAARRCVAATVEHDLLMDSGNLYCETEELVAAFKRVDKICKFALKG